MRTLDAWIGKKRCRSSERREEREVGTWPGQTCNFKILWARSFSIIKAFKLILLSSMGIWLCIFAWNLCYVMCHIYLNILGKGI